MIVRSFTGNRGCLQCALAFSLLVGSSAIARAELTVEDLTAGAVSGVGPFFQDVQDAIKAFAGKDATTALKHLEAAKKSTPKLSPPEVMLARLYLDAGQGPAGVALLERTIRNSPQDPEPYVILGERGLAEGRVTEAGLMFERASKLLEAFTDNPRRKQMLQARNYNGWAMVDENEGNWKAAQEKYEELTKVDPRNAKAHDRLAKVLFRAGDLKRAHSEFQSAAEADKSMLPADLAMAALSVEKDKDRAEKWLKHAISTNPSDLRTRLGACEFYVSQNRIDDAKPHADEAVKLDPNGLDANMIAGIVARLQGDYKRAEKHLSLAHSLAPANAVINNHLALSLIELPDEPSRLRALQYAEINAKQNPTIPDVVAALGWVNYRLNRRAEAQRAFTAVMNSGSASPTIAADMAFYLANLAAQQGQPAVAAKYLREALNNNQPFAYRKAAQTLLEQVSKQEKAQASKAKSAGSTDAAAKVESGEN
jgi:tetratricopeptide (TPR) repeat protein